MDSVADQLTRTADDIGTAARGFYNRADSIDFLGPAATRFRASVTQQRDQAGRVVDRAVSLAHTLRRAAEDARMQLAEWERYLALLERSEE